MEFRQVIICTDHGAEDWEATLVAGAAWYYGIASKVIDLSALPKSSEWGDLYVILAPSGSTVDYSLHEIIIRAGRQVTLHYLEHRDSPAVNEILVYGEPYALIQQILAGKVDPNYLAGKAMLGPLLGAQEYCTPLFELRRGQPRIMTSIGCQKKCGYCSYGMTYACLYPGAFERRERPWQALASELHQGMDKGVCDFIFLADQFLSHNPEENCELYNFIDHWQDGEKRPSLTFTVSPREILNNTLLFEVMSQHFELRPHLSIDSFDNRMLALLDLDFDASMAWSATLFLLALKLPLRINYIFGRPHATIEGILEELYYLEKLAEITSHWTNHQRLLLGYDIFSSSLQIGSGMPVALKDEISISPTLASELRPILRGVVHAMKQVEANILNAENVDPLYQIIEAAQAEAVKLV